MSRCKLFLLLSIVLLSSCSATGVRFSEITRNDLQGMSEVIIYRESKIVASGSTFCTKVNNQSLGVLQNGGFLRKTVKPGKQSISMPFDNSLYIEVETKPDETSYIEFTVNLAGMGVLPLGTVTAVSTSWNMAMVSVTPEYSLEKLPNLKESKYSATCKK